MKKYLSLLMASLLFPFLSCAPLSYSESERPDSPIPAIVENSELFPGTGNPGEYRFYSNEGEYINTFGMTFWAAVLPDQIPLVQLDVSLYKVSGNDIAGYGMVFCNGLRGDPAIETMLVLMINQQQEFIIGKVVGAQFSAIAPWEYSRFLISGYSQENRIIILFDEIDEEFSLYINNSLQMVFADNEEPRHRSGRSGFLTVISPLDRFPQIPVEILFQVH